MTDQTKKESKSEKENAPHSEIEVSDASFSETSSAKEAQLESDDQKNSISENADPEAGKTIESKSMESESARVEDQTILAGKEAKSDPELVHEKKPASKAIVKKSGRIAIVIVYFLFLLLALIVAAGAYFTYLNYEANKTQKKINASFDSRVSAASEQSSAQLTQHTQALEQQLQRRISELQTRLNAAEQRLQSQNKRLLSMSTTSREDWLLAEAEYLLKLGNQRVLIERSAESAVPLFEEADTILRDLADPDLFSLREAIKQDLVALKLAKSIDVQGIYLSLSALAKQVEQLPLVPESFNYNVTESPDADTVGSDSQSRWQRFINSFKKYVRIIDHDERPAAILPPDETAYLHLNLRFMIERAQTALMLQQANIYQQSLAEAELWVSRYFPSSQAAHAYRNELVRLKSEQVVAVLPDVSGSLELLNTYISNLHQLKPVTPDADVIAPSAQRQKRSTNNQDVSNGALNTDADSSSQEAL